MKESEGQSRVKCTGLALGGRRGQKRAQRRDDQRHGRKAKKCHIEGSRSEEVSWCGCHLCLLIAGGTAEPWTGQRQNPGFFWMRTKKGLSGKRFVHFTLIDNFAQRPGCYYRTIARVESSFEYTL